MNRRCVVTSVALVLLLLFGRAGWQQAGWSQERPYLSQSPSRVDENGDKSAETGAASQTTQSTEKSQKRGNTSPSEQPEPSDETSSSKRPETQNSGSADDDEATEAERTDYFNEDLLRKLLDGHASDRQDGGPGDGSKQRHGEQLDGNQLDGNQRNGEQLDGDDPLETAIRSMREAQQRLSARDTGAETQELQQRAVDELTRLIEMAENSSSQQNPPPPDQDRPENDQSRPQEQASQSDAEQSSQETQQTQQAVGTGKTEGGQSEKAKESSERTGPQEKREVELLRRRALLQQVWGHLPPGVRQKLLNVTSEKPLPEYEDLVRRYYEALAGDKVTE